MSCPFPLLRSLTPAILMALVLSSVAMGQQPKIALHVKAPGQEFFCTTPTLDMPCSDYRLTGNTGEAHEVYLVVANSDPQAGIAGISCGIDYAPETGEGIDVLSWVSCGDLEFPNPGPFGDWPAPGGGNRVAWDSTINCQRNIVPGSQSGYAVVGAFYVYAYSPDRFRVTTNNNLYSGPELAMADCMGNESFLPLSAMAEAGFGAETSCNPCLDSCTGQLPPLCRAEPDTLRFGSLEVGNSKVLSFTLSNNGEGYLFGSIPTSCGNGFNVIGGAGDFLLTGDQTLTVTIRFTPYRTGSYSCTLIPGGNCSGVRLTGHSPGLPGNPECLVTPAALNYGVLRVGEETWRWTYVLNLGWGSLPVDPELDSDQYRIIIGNFSFKLGRRSYQAIKIFFVPTRPGLHRGLLYVSDLCDEAELVGRALPDTVDTKGEPTAIEVDFDCRPNLCPNVINGRSEQVFHAAILGSPTFSPAQIDISTIRLMGSLKPLGVKYQDFGGRDPLQGDCACPDPGRDGYEDLRLTVSVRDFMEAMGSDQGTDMSVLVTGFLRDGTQFFGEDCLTLIGPELNPQPADVGLLRIRSLGTSRGGVLQLEYTLPEAAEVEVMAFDVAGRRVDEILIPTRPAGQHEVSWNTSKLPSGIYFLRIQAGGQSAVEKVTVIH